MKKIIVLLLVAAAAAYLLLWPVPVDPVAWDAPEAPELSGRYAANDDLAEAERLAAGQGHGPEDVAIDDQGRILQTIDQPAGDGHAPITSVIEHDSQLLFASPWADGVRVMPKPSAP